MDAPFFHVVSGFARTLKFIRPFAFCFYQARPEVDLTYADTTELGLLGRGADVAEESALDVVHRRELLLLSVPLAAASLLTGFVMAQTRTQVNAQGRE